MKVGLGALGLGGVISGKVTENKVREFTADEWFGQFHRDGKYYDKTDSKACLEGLRVGEKIRITEFDDVDDLQYRFDKLYHWDIRDDIMGSPILRARRYLSTLDDENLTLEVTRQK